MRCTGSHVIAYMEILMYLKQAWGNTSDGRSLIQSNIHRSFRLCYSSLSAWILLKRRGPAIRWRPLLSSPNSFWYRAGIMNPVHMLRVRKSETSIMHLKVSLSLKLAKYGNNNTIIRLKNL